MDLNQLARKVRLLKILQRLGGMTRLSKFQGLPKTNLSRLKKNQRPVKIPNQLKRPPRVKRRPRPPNQNPRRTFLQQVKTQSLMSRKPRAPKTQRLPSKLK